MAFNEIIKKLMWKAFTMSLDHTGIRTYIRLWGTTKKMASRPCNYLFHKSTKYGDAQVDLEGVGNLVYTQPNIILFKEPGLYWQRPNSF